MASKNRRAIPKFGRPCPRCGQKMAAYEPVTITQKMLKSSYFLRWFICENGACPTSVVTPEEYRVVGGLPSGALNHMDAPEIGDVERMRKLLRRVRPFLSGAGLGSFDRAKFEQVCREVDHEIDVTSQLESEGVYWAPAGAGASGYALSRKI